MLRIIQKTKVFILARKAVSAIILLVIIVAGYYGYKKLTDTSSEPRYILASVEKGTLIVSITGSGQVSSSNQIDLKPKASGDVIYLGVESGQEVWAGTWVAQLDSRDAQKSVRDAEMNLESAKISLQKLEQPADVLSLIQAENSLSQAKESLNKAYDSGFNSVSNTFLDMPSTMAGLQDILFGTTVSRGTQDNISAYSDLVKNYDENVLKFKDSANAKYSAARQAYDKNFNDYRSVSRSSDTQTIKQMVNETYETTKAVAEAVKSANDLLNFVKDRLVERQQTLPALLATHQSSLATYTSQTSTHLVDLLGVKSTITSSNQSIAEKTESLAKLKRGADPLDISSQELSLKQRENALLDAQNNLANYYVRAPFDGTIAKVSVKKYDAVSSGTAIATLITKQKLAEISLNEVDATKIKVGQKATFTFDAVEGLNISGEVAEVDTVATVSQGVVTYSVKIGFDTQDERVKSGMSVSAAIITDVKQDVLLVTSSAVKSQGNSYYIETFNPKLSGASNNQGVLSATLPQQQSVEVGLSNDTQTEILSGLKEGDQVVSRTITSQTTTTASAPSLFGGGGNMRVQGR